MFYLKAEEEGKKTSLKQMGNFFPSAVVHLALQK